MRVMDLLVNTTAGMFAVGCGLAALGLAAGGALMLAGWRDARRHPHGRCRVRREEQGFRIGHDLVQGQIRGDQLWAPLDDPAALGHGWIATPCACCEQPLFERQYPNGAVWTCPACLAHRDAGAPDWWWRSWWKRRQIRQRRNRVSIPRSNDREVEQQDFASQIYRSGL